MINFSSKNEGTWFYFEDNNPDFGGVCLVLPTSADYEAIKKLTVRPGKPDYHRGQRYETEVTNEKLSEKLSLRRFIVDWKGVSLDGELIKCTDENKEKLMKINDFRIFVGDCIEKLTETNKTIEAARLKNLETSADGDAAQEG